MDRCIKCGKPIQLEEWFIDLSESESVHEHCLGRDRIQLAFPGLGVKPQFIERGLRPRRRPAKKG